ncbi:hypothetical protein [Marinicauda sp. Alg238-R41]|uniref:hypothetical protein n=1 Tax=Marinicauda sp. Alg238-R41 TaxID=2993447 RepID=UPI0022E7A784|nr:hypothetical protein [Marinicauda sp. Alg238-R41]
MSQPVSQARKSLWRAILIGGAGGLVLGAIVGVLMALILGPVSLSGAMGARAILFLAFEAGFAGAIVGSLVAAMFALRHRSQRRPPPGS